MHPITVQMYARTLDDDRYRRAAGRREARRLVAARRAGHRAGVSCWLRRRAAAGLGLMGAPRVARRLASC